ncbi:MAG: Lysophospholipase, alpha-beta hydrolase superfamily [Candidatus Kentron sp. G]|nr:MAG: Lysophospholipase, alpha-beta hydrolase superfamily [Candidatus Kentron sp. G]VFN05006.1 MAG: Lysophospholipase, alpha-beta hydrolase superfamily [Candidatus Kentron sp. G]VFN05644.1 MAG: Lysophospholipase, alpha-beta hydrolase superfamily [Candidatus Kentron sp. G]
MKYSNQPVWKDIQTFLPEDKRLTPKTTPREEIWEWRGHKVHLDHLGNTDSPVKVILFHGVGTNGRQMSMIIGAPLFRLGYDVVAIDMPTYGLTRVNPGEKVIYDDWVALASDFVHAEQANTNRPVFLYGVSAGGMLAYHVAAHMTANAMAGPGMIAGIGGTTFLDQRERTVRDKTSRNLFMSRIGAPFAHLAARTPLSGLEIPMRLASKMHRLTNNPDALRVFLKDRTSAGNWASMGFLSSYLRYRPAIEPEAFHVCPILLTQPAVDTWTPLALSELFLDRIRHVATEVVILENAGHYPMEEPGLTRMSEAIHSFILSMAEF